MTLNGASNLLKVRHNSDASKLCIKASGSAGVDSGDLDAAEAAAMFGQTQGYKVSEPNVTTDSDEDNDF